MDKRIALVGIGALALSGCAIDSLTPEAVQHAAEAAVPVATTVGGTVGASWVGPLVGSMATLVAAAFGVHRKIGDAITAIRPIRASKS